MVCTFWPAGTCSFPLLKHNYASVNAIKATDDGNLIGVIIFLNICIDIICRITKVINGVQSSPGLLIVSNEKHNIAEQLEQMIRLYWARKILIDY